MNLPLLVALIILVGVHERGLIPADPCSEPDRCILPLALALLFSASSRVCALIASTALDARHYRLADRIAGRGRILFCTLWPFVGVAALVLNPAVKSGSDLVATATSIDSAHSLSRSRSSIQILHSSTERESGMLSAREVGMVPGDHTPVAGLLSAPVIYIGLILLPLIANWFWWSEYELKRRPGHCPGVRERLQDVDLRIRHGCTLIVPITLAAIGINGLRIQGLLSEGHALTLLFVMLGMLVICLPRVLKHVLSSSHLPDDLLPLQLDPILRRSGIGRDGVLTWCTGGRVMNALVAGFSPFRRYVFLSDRLIRDFDRQQVSAVLLHELAHAMRLHAWQRIVFLLLPGGFLLAGEAIVTSETLLEPESWSTLVLAPLYGLYIFVCFGWWCRYLEYDADQVACELLCRSGLVSTTDRAAQLYAETLEALARGSNVPRNKASWLHPSIAQRTTRILNAKSEIAPGHAQA